MSVSFEAAQRHYDSMEHPDYYDDDDEEGDDVEVNVFDDPVYCEDGKFKCVHLDSTKWGCNKYATNTLLKHKILRWFLKCEQCKKEYRGE